MDRKVIDLGFAIAVLDVNVDAKTNEKEPILTIMVPETDEDDAKCIYIIGHSGLRNLAAVLHEGLDEYDTEATGEQKVNGNPIDKPDGEG